MLNSGRAASCTAINSGSPTSASARITDCCRVSPPATNETRSLFFTRSSSTGATGTTTRVTRSSSRKRSMTCWITGLPDSVRNCFGSAPPKRDPVPAAGTMTATLIAPPSDRHDVLLFVLQDIRDVVDVFVGELLDLVERALLVVLGDGVILQHLLQLVDAVAPHLADRGARL